jgi:ribosomal protein S18 acetylase RimI-like enzyme
VSVRAATEADLPALEELWREFEREVPEPDHVDVDEAKELGEIAQLVRSGIALLAERDGEPVGYALAELQHPRSGFVSDVYVRPAARR